MSFWDNIEPGPKVRNIDGDYEWFPFYSFQLKTKEKKRQNVVPPTEKRRCVYFAFQTINNHLG